MTIGPDPGLTHPTTPALAVRQLHKTYARMTAVDDLSFEVHYGEIFGLLGPNGAGKTTSIRMILDIIKPTAGEIQVLGGPMEEAKKARIGYLPEERGLYDDMTLWDTLNFLGRLKGLSYSQSKERTEQYLHLVELWDARNLKINALSRGMNQKAQFAAATMHEPDLIIVDEPFSGLDPVNTRIIKNLVYAMRDRGAAIIMSTHQMHQVEEMCERILLMNHGKQMLYGPLSDVRRRFADHAVEVRLQEDHLDPVPGVARITKENGGYRLLLEEDTQPSDVLKTLVQRESITVERFEQVETSLDEIFVRVVGRTPDEVEPRDEGEPAQDGPATGSEPTVAPNGAAGKDAHTGPNRTPGAAEENAPDPHAAQAKGRPQ